MASANLKDILKQSLSEFQTIFLKEGEHLIRQGALSDAMYWLVSGRLHVVLEKDQEPDQIVAEISKGETVGEMSLVTKRRRTTSVIAARDCELLRISKNQFDEILIKHPEVLLELTRTIANRLSSTTRLREVDSKPKVILFMPAGNDLSSYAIYARNFAAALSARAKVAVVDVHTLGARISKKEQEDSQILKWFNNLESQNDFVVLISNAQADWWTARCIRSADRIYLVADAKAKKEPGEVENWIFQNRPSQALKSIELILLNESSSESLTGTRDWTTGRTLKRVHQASLSSELDYQRQMRLFLGEAIGLVLGGGGARGLAHVGVVKAMGEIGIPIDMVGCTSVGSIVGGMLALGQSPRSMLDNFAQYSNQYQPYKKYTIPFVSLLQVSPIENFYRSLFGEADIEDAKIPFFCVSCNLNLAQKVIHESGKLWRAVRASTAIPGAFAPLISNKSLLVDGGIMDNLPIREMRSRGANKIIAVDVAPLNDLQFDTQLNTSPSGWSMLKNRIFNRKSRSKFPSMTEILMRTLMVNSVAKRLEGGIAADLVLRPPVEGKKILDFSKMEETSEIGYNYAKPLLAEFWNTK